MTRPRSADPGANNRVVANLDGRAVYDGREFLGRVFETPTGCHAENADGRDLGRYPNRAAVEHAALIAARRS